MSKLKTAVIGVGYLGKFHADKYAALPNSDLIAVVDSNEDTANSIADKHNIQALTDYHDLLGKVDAVSIAVPTSLHFQIARDFLDHGSHVLIEKPITVTVDQADELIALARSRQRLIQVGHLERFNAAILDLDQVLEKPMFIESHRLAPFNPRATDVNVVLDLMIHDIDIILNMVKSDIVNVHAVGVPILSELGDIANARLEFASGCVANVTASRVSLNAMRKIRVFQSDAYFSIDYQKRKIAIFRKGDGGLPLPGLPGIFLQERDFTENDPLMDEVKSFVGAVRHGTEPLVSGEDGRRALEVALQISSRLGGVLPG